MDDTVNCPECGQEIRDLWDHDWGVYGEELVTSCGSCGKEFTLLRHVTVRYEVRRLPVQVEALKERERDITDRTDKP